MYFFFFFFFFNDTATTEIYTLSLHDALPIRDEAAFRALDPSCVAEKTAPVMEAVRQDRKSTRLNSSHMSISYAVFCLKKKTELSSLNSGLYSTGRVLRALSMGGSAPNFLSFMSSQTAPNSSLPLPVALPIWPSV